jgi:hypothetical protein
MIAFLLSLWANPLARKIIIYCAITLGILYGLRLWGNKQWQKGEIQGRMAMGKDIEKQKQAEWKAKEAALALAAKNLDQDKRSVLAATEQLRQDRTNLSKTLSDAQAAIQRERNRQYEAVNTVPDLLLWDAIRAVSAELAFINGGAPPGPQPALRTPLYP